MYIKHQIIMPGIFSATQMLHPYALKWCFSINTCSFHRVQHSPHCLRSDLVFENKDRHLHQRKAELFTVGESMVSWGPDLKSYLQDPPPHTHTHLDAGWRAEKVGRDQALGPGICCFCFIQIQHTGGEGAWSWTHFQSL